MSWTVVKDLKEKRAQVFAQANEIRALARKEERDMTADEAAKHDKMLADVERYGKEIEAEERSLQVADSMGVSKSSDFVERSNSVLGFSPKQMQRYSLLRALRSRINNKPLDGFEKEVSDEIARRSGKAATGFYMPTEAGFYQRAFDLAAATGGVGIQTQSSLIELLRNETLAGKLGVTYLSDLNGKVSFPRVSGGATAYWITEGSDLTASAASVDQVALANKQVGAYTDITRMTIQQTSFDAEALVVNDIMSTIGLALDKAIFQGSGSAGQPFGILNTASIPTVAMGTNGAAVTRASVLSQAKTLGEANAKGDWKYVTTYANKAKMQTIDRGTDTGKYLWADDGTVEGYAAYASNQMPNNLTKGSATAVCSASIFGNFSDVLVGLWGGLDITIDPYSLVKSGGIRVVAIQDVDVALRHLGSFVVVKDLLTT